MRPVSKGVLGLEINIFVIRGITIFIITLKIGKSMTISLICIIKLFNDVTKKPPYIV